MEVGRESRGGDGDVVFLEAVYIGVNFGVFVDKGGKDGE